MPNKGSAKVKREANKKTATFCCCLENLIYH